jgi:dTDP-4-dehydrorhamnose reductase
MNAKFTPDHLIVRTQWLYGLNGKNFVETMLRLAGEKDELAVVDDQTGSPTWTVDLARAIRALIEHDCKGIYHAANNGFCSWNDFAKAIFEESGISIRVNPLTTDKLNRPARRPLYSTLDCSKLAADSGCEPQSWREALKQYLNQRKGDDYGTR